jgi:hypothetical protein
MSNEEKGQWVYLVVFVVTYLAYVAIVLGQAAGGPLTEVDYVPMLLGAIGVGIAIAIVGRIVVGVAEGIAAEVGGHEPAYDPDVRDRDIGRFGEYISGTVLGVAMIVPFVLALAEADTFWIANGMYLAFVLAAVIGAAVKLVAYRRGL